MRSGQGELRANSALALLALALFGCGHAASPCAANVVAQAIAARLGNVAGLGQATVRGDEIVFSSSKLALDVSEQATTTKAGHFHVLARLEGAAGELDACIFGLGATPETARANAAERYVEQAFAPTAALIDPAAPVIATPFSGDEPYGVAGYRGFVGRMSTSKGTDPATLVSAAVFAGLQGIPADGRAHIAKAVLVAEHGSWTRTLELDGKATAIASQPWSGAPVPSVPGAAVVFAVFGRPDTLASTQDRAEATRILDGHPAWLPGAGCPADIAPATLAQPIWSSRLCAGGRLRDCVSECESGRATSCYSAAIDLQHGDPSSPEQALFLRACRLGNASACTNAAAGRSPMDECSVRTFEKTCAQTGDAWGCEMFGLALATGKGIARDVERARVVLAKACVDKDDPACKAATRVLDVLALVKQPQQ